MTTVRRIAAFAPGTVSNLGPGFDVFGLALEAPGDVVVVERAEGSGVVSVNVTGNGLRIPTDPKLNSASAAASAVLAELGSGDGISMEIRKGLPLAAGLGGSAASAVAGAVATDALLGAGLPPEDLLRAAIRGEEAGSGAAHADNAAPSLMGGFVVVLPGDPLRVVPVPTPDDMRVVVVHPHVEVETRRARQLLEEPIALENAIRQWGNAAGLIAGLYTGDWELISRCVSDSVAEPIRKALVPSFDDVVAAAREAGAVACGLSGSGPSVFALCRGASMTESVGIAMARAFRNDGGVESDVIVSSVSRTGARIVDEACDPDRESAPE